MSCVKKHLGCENVMNCELVEKRALTMCDVMSCELMEKSHIFDLHVRGSGKRALLMCDVLSRWKLDVKVMTCAKMSQGKTKYFSRKNEI
jgi:hypothetical protein